MKIRNFFTTVTRQLAKVSGSTRVKPFAQTASRASSLSSTSTPKRMHAISSMTSEDSFSSHYAAHGQAAAQRAFTRALQAGLADPLGTARASAKAAIVVESRRIGDMVTTLGTAERNHSRAKYQMATVNLQLRKAQRTYGANSAVAQTLLNKQKQAADQLTQAAVDLYLAQIAC